MRRFVAALSVLAMAAWALTTVVFPAGAASAALPSATPAMATAVTAPGGFVSLPSSRLLDTRSGVGAPKGAIAAGHGIWLQVTGAGGVPDSGVSAVVLTVTVTQPSRAGYVTVYPHGDLLPGTSNLNFVAGQTVANLVIVPVGVAGQVDMDNGSAGSVQLIADVSGYYLSGPPQAPRVFNTLPSSRLLDTRSGVGAPKSSVAAGGTLHLRVAGAGNVPASGVSAVLLNVTVTAPTKPGFLTVYGDGHSPPGTSNLNFVAGQTVPNLVIAPVGANGDVALYNGSAGTVHLIADVSGYYLSGLPTVPGAFGSLTPDRLLDTRSGLGAPKVSVAAGGRVQLQVGGRGGVPDSEVSAVVLNITVVAPTKPGFVTVYGEGTARPGTSNLNFVAGQTVPNLVIAPVGPGGKVALYNGSAGTVQLIADVSGWFTDTLEPVTAVTATPTGTSIALSWTNPTAASLTGVMIRRAIGTIAPISTTTGDFVGDAASPATSFTDSGLQPGTQYSYALFAHDGAPSYATAATATATTLVWPPTAISGTVTDAGGAHHGLANVGVMVRPVPWTNAFQYVWTDADGNYTVTSLAAGTYSVCFSASSATGGSTDTNGYVNQCYDGLALPVGVTTPVNVTTGQTTTGIDAAMVEKGAISGMVTDAAGSQSAVSRFAVTATSPSTGATGNAIVSPDGSYTTTGVPPGTDYRVCFQSSGPTRFVDQCYDNQATPAAATPVAVTSGVTTSGIDAALTAWGTISGTVTDAGGTHQGLANVNVMISSASTGAVGGGTTAADGTYSSNSLPAATDYKVCFIVNGATGGPGDAAGYVNQCYNNQSITATPTPVTVTPGVSTTIGAALVRGGAVAGTVIDAGGSMHGLAHVSVEVSSASTGDHAWAATAADGSYTVQGLDVATDYQVCFHGSAATGGSTDTAGYLDQCWANQPTSGTPTPIALTSGATTTDINAALASKT